MDFLNVIEVGNGDRGFTNSDAVRWLVEHGVDIHKTNEVGIIGVYVSVPAENSFKCFCADICLQYGITAFDTAVRYGRLDIIKFLEQLPEASRVNVESIVKVCDM